VDVDDDDDAENDEVALEKIEADDAELGDDEGSVVYNKAVVYSMRDKAIQLMKDEKVILSTGQVNEALAIMPKVCSIFKGWHSLTSFNTHRCLALLDVFMIQQLSRNSSTFLFPATLLVMA
jgi:hypothetical protein